MNRLILVGNGFDLAKGLESSYQHFIDWMWKQISDKYFKKNTSLNDDDFVFIEKTMFTTDTTKIKDYPTFKEFLDKYNVSREFKNKFFEIITPKADSDWVDIETEYFNALKNILQGKTEGNPQNNIEKLNNDFEEIKLELQKYLTKELTNFEISQFDNTNISEHFNLLDFTSKGVEDFEKEYVPKMNLDEKIQFYAQKNKLKLGDYSYSRTVIFPQNTLFLNFNYTDLIPKLTQEIKQNAWELDDWAKSKMDHIYIHGELTKKANPIIFGYGDENDEIQNEIEKRGGDYLNNIKTINYLKTPNYKKVLSFLDSDNYQVFIMGHSCGLSDKTLLKTIFEHPNCISIRPFYYIDKNGNNNYNEIVKNIYRTFSDKALMRDKVVNQEYCCELKI